MWIQNKRPKAHQSMSSLVAVLATGGARDIKCAQETIQRLIILSYSIALLHLKRCQGDFLPF